jgi:CheY-like chemotaxis protein
MEANPTRTTVLLIDPHKEDREYWTQRLNISSPDYVVLEAETGKAGLLLCGRGRIDCVLVEVSLPDMSGFEVLVKLVPRARAPEIAVIFLTRLAALKSTWLSPISLAIILTGRFKKVCLPSLSRKHITHKNLLTILICYRTATRTGQISV